MILRHVTHALSPCGSGARLSILIFHRVLSQADELFPQEPDMVHFDKIIGWVKQWFNVLSLDSAVRQLQMGTLPARAAAITFDDGYADNVGNALPVLQRHGVAATFFISTDFLDGGCMWNDSVIESIRCCTPQVLDLSAAGFGLLPVQSLIQKRKAIEYLLGKIKYLNSDTRQRVVDQIVDMAGSTIPTNLMMSSDQVLELRNARMQVGAHTCSHPILKSITHSQALREITRSKLFLESLLSESVTLFAYPNGKPNLDYSADHVAMVREAGFSAAVTTAVGVARQTTDPLQLPRFTPWDRTRFRYGVRMLGNLCSGMPEVAQIPA